MIEATPSRARPRAPRSRGPAHPPEEVALRLAIGLKRDLTPVLVPDRATPERPTRFLREACEDALLRVAENPGCAPMETRALFSRTRSLYAAHGQVQGLAVIEAHLARAGRILSRGRR